MLITGQFTEILSFPRISYWAVYLKRFAVRFWLLIV